MGKITLNVVAGTAYSEDDGGPIVTDCYSQYNVTVLHGGTNKYISFIKDPTDTFISASEVAQTITADKQVTLWVYGDTRDNQTVSSFIGMEIRQTDANGTLLATVRLQRFHKGVPC